MDGLEILNRCRSTQIENILTHAEIASARALSRGDMSESMFDPDAPALLRTTGRCGLENAKLLLQPLVGGADGSTLAVR